MNYMPVFSSNPLLHVKLYPAYIRSTMPKNKSHGLYSCPTQLLKSQILVRYQTSNANNNNNDNNNKG